MYLHAQRVGFQYQHDDVSDEGQLISCPWMTNWADPYRMASGAAIKAISDDSMSWIIVSVCKDAWQVPKTEENLSGCCGCTLAPLSPTKNSRQWQVYINPPWSCCKNACLNMLPHFGINVNFQKTHTKSLSSSRGSVLPRERNRVTYSTSQLIFADPAPNQNLTFYQPHFLLNYSITTKSINVQIAPF